MDRLERLLDDALDSTEGMLSRRKTVLEEAIADYGDQVDAIDARLAVRKERYLQKFATMERLLSEMQSTSSTLTSMLASIPSIRTSSGSSA